MTQGMTQGEKLIWAAMYVNTLATCNDDTPLSDQIRHAIFYASATVQALRQFDFGSPLQASHKRMALTMLGSSTDSG